ncbi:ubiquitin thioesterase OTU1-like [Pyrus ussuriensis x Pyrus communis]|uniref:Ubiquitin thioesterase OTU n=1 Tax=Pyrus ussuriensis x Pyrus communis TaxID=2448454 RepID=A0A5N5FLC7_9ROSA|nr:ubiquitin thioesterase OTU1-like [Pyrus ussuriensis x Pyrus communis]
MEGIVLRRVIPSDNGCLFNAVGYVMDHDQKKAPELRQVIAATVASDPTKYSEAFLGTSNGEYCAWILDSEKWGGLLRKLSKKAPELRQVYEHSRVNNTNMSKATHEIKGFNPEFQGWYNMEPPPLSGSLKANLTSSFSSVDLETLLKNLDQVRGKLDYLTGMAEYWNHKLMKAEKELVDLNDEDNEVHYHASKQKTKADMSRERITFLNFELFQMRWGHIESYECSREGKAEMEKERYKGFEDSRRLVKRKEPHKR